MKGSMVSACKAVVVAAVARARHTVGASTNRRSSAITANNTGIATAYTAMKGVDTHRSAF